MSTTPREPSSPRATAIRWSSSARPTIGHARGSEVADGAAPTGAVEPLTLRQWTFLRCTKRQATSAIIAIHPGAGPVGGRDALGGGRDMGLGGRPGGDGGRASI
jgi:hypothetical protein